MSAMIARRWFVAAAAASVWARTGEFWNEKKAEDWSEKDIQKLITHSPWAKEVTVELPAAGPVDMGRSGGRGARGGGGGGGTMPDASQGSMGGGGDMGGGGRGGGGRGGGGGGGEMGDGATRRPEIKALVRWESARPVCDARKKDLPKELAGAYVVSVSGMPLEGGWHEGERQGGARHQEGEGGEGAAGFVERLKQATQLRRKNADPIYPARVLENSPGQVRYFVFPYGSQPIQASDKEVVFHIGLGHMELKAKFALKDMMYRGELAL